MSSQVQDKNAKPVKKGDEVWTPIRGGKHQGNVDSIIQSDEEANEAGVKNPPKVLFSDQHGHNVAHNPETLQHVEKK